METFATFMAGLLLIPYIGVGVWLLRRRFRHWEELSMVVEACALIWCAMFFAVEMVLLDVSDIDDTLMHLFAVLGLFVSGVALYGHVAVSLVSRIVVGVMAPGNELPSDRPRLGPAEALEKTQDWEGALEEYLVMARMFPRDVVLPGRIAECLVKQGRAGESMVWWEKALKVKLPPEKKVVTVLRVADVLTKELDREEASARVMAHFIAEYPNSPEAQSLRERLASAGAVTVKEESVLLARMALEPLHLVDAAPMATEEVAAVVSVATMTLERMAELEPLPLLQKAIVQEARPRRRAKREPVAEAPSLGGLSLEPLRDLKLE